MSNERAGTVYLLLGRHHGVGVAGGMVGVEFHGPLLRVVVVRCDELHLVVVSVEAQQE